MFRCCFAFLRLLLESVKYVNCLLESGYIEDAIRFSIFVNPDFNNTRTNFGHWLEIEWIKTPLHQFELMPRIVLHVLRKGDVVFIRAS